MIVTKNDLFNCKFSKFEKNVISYFSNLEYSQLKKLFIFSKILPLNPIPVRGAESAPFGVFFSCAAHLLNDLRSPKYYISKILPLNPIPVREGWWIFVCCTLHSY